MTYHTSSLHKEFLQQFVIAHQVDVNGCWLTAIANLQSMRHKAEFDLLGNLIHGQMPYMKFLYVRSDACRQFLSDFTSQWIRY